MTSKSLLVISGNGWAFISRFDMSGNGCTAVAALRLQCEGEADHNRHKTIAYAMISVAKYIGERKSRLWRRRQKKRVKLGVGEIAQTGRMTQEASSVGVGTVAVSPDCRSVAQAGR